MKISSLKIGFDISKTLNVKAYVLEKKWNFIMSSADADLKQFAWTVKTIFLEK